MVIASSGTNESLRSDEDKTYSCIRDFKDPRTRWQRKLGLRSFSLTREYSYPLTLSNVGEYARDHIQARKRQVKFRRRLFTSSINRKIKQFDVVVVQKNIKVDE